VITGAGTSLRDDPGLPPEARRELAATITEEGERLNRLVANLLDMTRLESGAVEVRRGWHSIEELIGAALGRLEPALEGRPVRVDVAPGTPLVALDDVLIEQALFNLLDNALKYSPSGSGIDVTAALEAGALAIAVADRGTGLPAGQEEGVFEKFARGARQGEPGGIGLGLAIVRGIAAAHGGHVRAANRDGGGAVFTLELPLVGTPPAAPEGEAAP
jgi:two-component system sensor histidine kinase KdpD